MFMKVSGIDGDSQNPPHSGWSDLTSLQLLFQHEQNLGPGAVRP
jgi:hypothetical protein